MPGSCTFMFWFWLSCTKHKPVPSAESSMETGYITAQGCGRVYCVIVHWPSVSAY
jgi:hypothetical protein